MNSPERKTVGSSDSLPNAQPELQANGGESGAKCMERKPAASTLFLLALAAFAFYVMSRR
jgi:hypothetical protein